jgi:hypothetical protein
LENGRPSFTSGQINDVGPFLQFLSLKFKVSRV